ncbi:MAG: hypothetical protein K2O58_03585, partial [Bacteroidales bacterium]|nr:hypothetical protein [Bacteroidales bacterium]
KIYARKEKYFSQAHREALSKALSSSGTGLIDIPSEDKAGSLKVDFYYSTKDGSGYARMYEYVPYQYVPASLFHECPLCRIQKLLK